MQHIMLILLWLTLSLLLTPHDVQAQDDVTPTAPATWSAPTILYPEAWPAPRYPTASATTARDWWRLIPNSGGDDNSRHIVFSEAKNGVWQTPTVVAQNGAYSAASFQVLPQRTHPVISGDGKTIAYVGYTGATYGLYVLHRATDGTWSAPALVNTGLAQHTLLDQPEPHRGNAGAQRLPILGDTAALRAGAQERGLGCAGARLARPAGRTRAAGCRRSARMAAGWSSSATRPGAVQPAHRHGWSAPVAVTSHDTRR
jgi:hypothetical protein